MQVMDAEQKAAEQKAAQQKKRHRYFYNFTSGLLYPAALGAGLAWIAQSFPAMFWNKEGWLVIVFAIWFITAYASWFVRLIEKHREKNGDEYGGGYLTSDIVDVLIVVGAFFALGLLASPYDRPQYTLVFIAVLSVPVATGVSLWWQGQKSIVLERKCPLITTVVVSVIGFGLNFSSVAEFWMNAIAVAVLYICLYFYLNLTFKE